MSWWSRFRRARADWHDVSQRSIPVVEKFDESLTPNMRALRFAMTASDLLLSMGVSANSVVTRALDITETYCTRPVHIDIDSNLLMFSQLRSNDKEPLTFIRPVALRDVNYMTIQAVQRLIYEIHERGVSLDEAEERLERILQHPQSFPWWVIMMGNGIIVGGVALMFTSSWQVVLTTFIIGMLVDRVVGYLGRRAFPGFFRQIAAAFFVTMIAAAINFMAHHGVDFFAGMNPTLIVVGGIIMLVAGLAFVSAIQDAIEEYYVTANARMSKVFLQTIGIVVGIMIGLYIARKVGLGIAVSPDPLVLNSLHFQLIGAALAAVGYAIATQTNWRAIVWVGIIGGGALSIMYSSTHLLGISFVPASGIAAAFVGIVASFMSRFWGAPAVGIIAAGIVPLVPGLTLYNGLMQLMNHPPGDPLFFKSLGTLFTVGTTGLAIAAGAALGNIIGRPFRQKVAADRNLAPFLNFLDHQLHVKPRFSLARFVLGQTEPTSARGDQRDDQR